jgi:hypothetical protein
VIELGKICLIRGDGRFFERLLAVVRPDVRGIGVCKSLIFAVPVPRDQSTHNNRP